ncbi:LysR family transcriptional regulator [Caballeronia calidae]|uniref:LysR family transcriptional regulator n=1 Tax=Caballeronia calidae TaxID=1777139 RepID=A0A158EC79_9BURK|nr:LysR substrate-binding domain-containing protein [Caballeronia calidae]SAL04373.1 LysR family transcriptional regulator [Caballeronia calidae]
MDSRQLRVFVALSEDLHFARTADRLGVAQSVLSEQLKKLEADLGVKLLNRNKRAAVTLTDAGELLLVEATLALRQLDRAEAVGRLAARGEVGNISLGYVGSAVSTGVLQAALKTFRKANPQVEMHINSMETPRQLESLRDGQLDVGLLRSRSQYPEGVAATVVMREDLMIALSEDHPLAKSSSISARELCTEAFIVPQFSESEGLAENLANLGRCGGFNAEPRYRVADFVTALCMTTAGYGVVLVPQSMKSFAPADVAFRAVSDFRDEIELALAYRTREVAPCVKKFVDATIAQYPNQSSSRRR